MPVYMQIDNKKGDVSCNGHEGWMELSNIEFTAIRPVGMEVGRSCFRQPGQLVFKPIVLTKAVDAASINMLHQIYAAKNIEQISIDCCHTAEELEPHIRYILTDVMVTEYTLNVVWGVPNEKLVLTYESIQTRVIPVDSAGVSTKPASIGYNIKNASISTQK